MTRVSRGILLGAGILALTAGSAHAQAIGQIFGKVTDATGGVLPGVTVTVTGTGLQQPLVGVTAQSGAYQFPSVPIGTYTVTFELSGFKKAVRQNIKIDSGFNAEIDMKMEVGEKSVEMTVTAAGAGSGHEEGHDGRDVHEGDARADSDGARPVAGRQHGPGGAGGLERRRVVVGPAGGPVGLRDVGERAVEPRRRVDHGRVVELARRRISTSTRSSRSR